MKLSKLFFIFASTLLITGCGSKYQLTPIENNNYKILYSEGKQNYISENKHLVELIVHDDVIFSSNDVYFQIIITNNSNENILVSAENVTAKVNDKNHKIYSYRELIDRNEYEQALAALSYSFSLAANSLQTTTGSYYGNENYGTYQQTTTNNDSLVESNLERYDDLVEEKETLEKNILRKTTLLPNTTVKGYVALEKLPLISNSKSNNIKIIVNIDGEIHTFYIEQTTY